MKVKNLLVRYQIEGRGVVNFDHESQKFMFNKENNDIKQSQKIKNLGTRNNNVTYAKKSFFRNENGELDYKLKISSECLKKSLFENDYVSDNPSIMHFKSLMYNFMGSIPGQLRGYLFTSSFGVFKRKASINITDSIQTCNAQSYMDFHTKATNRNDKSEQTSLYCSENIGDITYDGIGNIDLKNLQFVSADACFDRQSFNDDDYPMLKDVIKSNIKTFDSDLGYYKMKNSAVDIPEYGFLYNNNDINFLIKEYLHRLVNVEIKRNNAYAKISKLEIKPVLDVFNDTHGNENGWLEIKNREDIDNISFDVQSFYELVDYDNALNRRLEYENKLKELLKKKKTEKKTEKK